MLLEWAKQRRECCLGEGAWQRSKCSGPGSVRSSDCNEVLHSLPLESRSDTCNLSQPVRVQLVGTVYIFHQLMLFHAFVRSDEMQQHARAPFPVFWVFFGHYVMTGEPCLFPGIPMPAVYLSIYLAYNHTIRHLILCIGA